MYLRVTKTRGKETGPSTVLSEVQEVNLVLFHFSSYFLFYFDLFFLFLFLAPRVKVSNEIGHLTQRRF